MSVALSEWEVVQGEIQKIYREGLIEWLNTDEFSDWQEVLNEAYLTLPSDEWSNVCIEYYDQYLKWISDYDQFEKMKAFQQIIEEIDEGLDSDYRLRFQKWLSITHCGDYEQHFNDFQETALKRDSTWRIVFPSYLKQMKEWLREYQDQDSDAAIHTHLSYLKKNLNRI